MRHAIWTVPTPIARAAVVSEKEHDCVLEECAVGCSLQRIGCRPVMPNVLGPELGLVSFGFAVAILNLTGQGQRELSPPRWARRND